MPEYGSDSIDEATVLALGRVAWTAINVEDSAVRIAKLILDENQGSLPAGQFLRKAMAKLAEQEQDFTTRLGLQYLQESIDALAIRNTILHSIPVINYTESGPNHFLLHFPRDGSKPVFTPREAPTLNAHADSFAAIYKEAPEDFRVLYDWSSEGQT